MVVTELQRLRSTTLTKQENQIVKLTVEGFGNREIAHKLGLTEHAVGDHLIRIYEKLGITSRVELVLCSPRAT